MPFSGCPPGNQAGASDPNDIESGSSGRDAAECADGIGLCVQVCGE